MGCSTAVAYIVSHPERVMSFALVSGRIGDLVASSKPEGLAARPELKAFDGTQASMRRMLEGVSRENGGEDLDEDLIAMRTIAAQRNIDRYLKNRMALEQPDQATRIRLSTRSRFDALPIPGIYLFGKNDPKQPPEIGGYPQEDALPNVQFFYPDQCGHQGQLDQPEMFGQVFLEFFTDGCVSWKTATWAGVSTRRAANRRLVDAPIGVASE
jgi:pimeloyl-ACP methyl ester carboxylesterase